MNEPIPDLSIRASTEGHEPSSSYWRERRRLAEALRTLSNHLFSREPDETGVSELAARLEALNADYEKLPLLEGRKGWLDESRFGNPDVVSVELSPLIGKSSAVAPPLKVWIENGEARAEVFCDWRFEGPPHCLHGGMVAALFDEFLGWVQMLSGGSGATKHLSVTYHKPTPLNRLLTMKARLVGVEGRKIRVSGELYAGEVMTASAEILFISFGSKGTTELYKTL